MTTKTIPHIVSLSGIMKKPLSFFDLETTAAIISQANFGITEMGVYAVRPDGKIAEFSQLMHPGFKIPKIVTEITGITDDMVANELPLSHWESRIRFLCQNTVMIGFNVRSYDVPALIGQFERYGLEKMGPIQILDIRDVWMDIQKTKKGKLTEVAAHYGCPFDGAHRAMSDVMGCVHLLEAMIEKHGMECIQQFIKTVPEFKDAQTLRDEKKQVDRAKAELDLIDRILESMTTGKPYGIEVWTADPIIGANATSLSFALNKMLDQHQITPDIIADDEAQGWLIDHWGDITADNPSSHLKPILEKAQALGAPDCVNYTQIKVSIAFEKQQMALDAAVEPTVSRPSIGKM